MGLSLFFFSSAAAAAAAAGIATTTTSTSTTNRSHDSSDVTTAGTAALVNAIEVEDSASQQMTQQLVPDVVLVCSVWQEE